MNENQNKRRTKRSFTLEEKRNYYIAWKKSGLGATNFCKTYGISRSALHQWNKHFNEEENDVGFLPLTAKQNAPVEQQLTIIQLYIYFANDLKLAIEMPEHRLVSFIQEIGYATAIVR